MAGGVGSRFWPLSTPEHPKQFIDIMGTGRTMLQATVDRFEGICPNENVYIITNASYKDIVKQQLPFIDDSQVLLEPIMRNTAPAIAYSVNKIKAKNANANIIVSPADHVVTKVDVFQEVILKTLEFTLENDALVTIGIKPSYPAMGYGYIKQSNTVKNGLYKVEDFKEKPKLIVAEQYIADGAYSWNSGIFVWNANAITQSLEAHLPDVQKVFTDIYKEYYTANEQNVINSVFPTCQNISIDYAIMEKADNVYVLPGDFGWSDLGSWRSLHELAEKDKDNNAIKGNIVSIESKGLVVHISEGKRLIVQGLEDFIIAEKNGNILICQKDEEQRIKEFQKL